VKTKTALFALILLTAAAHSEDRPYLIGYGVNPQNVTPKFVRENLEYMEKKPLDGVALSNKAGWTIMDGQPLEMAAIEEEFAPLLRLQFKKLKHNFAMVYLNRPADFFDDWNITIRNFEKLARVLREAGIDGIFFDNEAYKNGLFDYPGDCKYAGTKTLQEYQAQAELRGRQIMEAMVAINPKQYVLFFHGPYVSHEKTPKVVMPRNVAFANELMGPFFVGFFSGAGEHGKVCDGGELYHLRSKQDFEEAYQYRKQVFAGAANSVPWLTENLRGDNWARKCEVDFGVYNRGGQTAATLKATLINALRRTDRVVWLYVEGFDLFSPGGIPEQWERAISEARDEAGLMN
jgi:hypothetical protein